MERNDMERIGQFIGQVFATTGEILSWSLVFFVTHGILILALSLIPVAGRAAYILYKERLAGWQIGAIEAVVTAARIILIGAIFTFAWAEVSAARPAGADVSSALDPLVAYCLANWPLLVGQYLLLLLVFLALNLGFAFASGEVALLGWRRRIGPLRDLSERRRLLLTFTLKNLITIPLFMICLAGMARSGLM
jgi:hypothetical protein